MKRIPTLDGWRAISTALIVMVMCAFWVTLGLNIAPEAKKHDFLNIYTGAALAHEGRYSELHIPPVQLAAEQGIIPQLGTLVPFVRPGFYAALLSPLALLPYATAFAAWIAAQVLLLLFCWIWGWRRFGPDALVFAALSLPAPLGIASGQDCVVLLALFVAAYELAERKQPLASGAALALMLLKFHLILLWPVALLIQRRWRMFAGFCIMALAEAAVCVMLGGLQVIRSYADLLRNKSLDRLSPSPELMISYQGLAANLGIQSPVVLLAIIAVVVVIFLFAVRQAPLWRMFALTAAASLCIAPHVYGYDATLLLLPLWLTIFASTHPASRISATLMATPLPFGFALADKPWAVVSSASLILFFVILAMEALRPEVPVALPALEHLSAQPCSAQPTPPIPESKMETPIHDPA
jgi:hypothetical protein